LPTSPSPPARKTDHFARASFVSSLCAECNPLRDNGFGFLSRKRTLQNSKNIERQPVFEP
jgi:hypothetical protein